MYLFFQNLIDQDFALVYIDDIIILVYTRTRILELIEQLHQICYSNNLKIAPETSFYILFTVKFLETKLAIILLIQSPLTLMVYTN